MGGCSRLLSRTVTSRADGGSWRGRSIRWCSFGMWRRISMWRCRWMAKCGSMGSSTEYRVVAPGLQGSFDYTSACAKRTSTCSARMTEQGKDPIKQRSFGEEVVEGFYGGEFVIFDVEDGVELGDVEDVLNFLGKAEEFEFAAGVADGSEAADQFSDAGRVDVIDVGEVEDDFFLAFGGELADGVAELSDFVAESDASVDVDDGYVADFARGDGHGGWF